MPGTPFAIYNYLVAPDPNITLQVRLYQSGPPFASFPAFADFVEAVYTGYEPVTLGILGGPQQLGGGWLGVQGQNMAFTVINGPPVGCNVNGWFLTARDALGNLSVACWAEITPQQPMQKPGDQVIITPSFTVTQLTTPTS